MNTACARLFPESRSPIPARFQILLFTAAWLSCSCGNAGSVVQSDASDDGPDLSEVTDDQSYQVCDESSGCEGESECILGLCLPRCDGGSACVEGEVCWPGEGCLEECDDDHPCQQAFSCVDGTCEDDPCGHPEFWPLALESQNLPATVHYRHAIEQPVAAEVLGYLEYSWQEETVTLGFEPPLPDEGQCGPDGRFDVFIWRSYRAGCADSQGENDETDWDDAFTYLILDPWGPYGGERLDATVAHELNHAMQASYDWNEHGLLFEMTSQFIEELVYPDDDGYQALLYDFQGNPDWAFDYNDDWETWYWYGTVLYAFYLRDAVFAGDAGFLARIWERCKNPAGENEPDFEDALDELLDEQAGITFVDSLIPFSRWRYYTSTRDDGHHFPEGAELPEDSLVRIEREIEVTTPLTVTVEPGPMLLGVHFITLKRPAGGPEAVGLKFDGSDQVRWSLQLVPGLTEGSDGESLGLSGSDDVAEVHFGTRQDRTLVILALPLGETDPEQRTDDRFAYSLEFVDL